MDPLPSVNQAFSKIHQAEVQKSITASEFVPELDSVAMIASQQHTPGISSDYNVRGHTVGNNWKRGTKKAKVDRPFYCDHCHKSGHTRDFCWKLKNQKSRSSVQDAKAPYAGRRFAAHVEEAQQFDGDTPCDVPQQCESSVFPPDPSFVQAVAKKLFRLQNMSAAPAPHSLADGRL
ncbi:hypothetical protein RND81_01G065900 [Saponaria officinalis]|uniref:Uncharacterized protein n=1 Tax=Saponaria officinalis TaxID=3572 RepID=A0AAW1NC79_SAPOF